MNPLFNPKVKERTVSTLASHVAALKTDNKYKILLFGDSIFERLNEYPCFQELAATYSIFNGSVGGDGIEHMLYRAKEGFPSLFPDNLETIILLAGTNNIERYDENKVFAGFLNLLNVIKSQRNVKIIILGLPPRFSSTKKISDDKIMTRVKNYNKLLSGVSDCQYHDFSSKLLNDGSQPDRKFFVDHVHFSDLGYEQFMNCLTNVITSIE